MRSTFLFFELAPFRHKCYPLVDASQVPFANLLARRPAAAPVAPALRGGSVPAVHVGRELDPATADHGSGARVFGGSTRAVHGRVRDLALRGVSSLLLDALGTLVALEPPAPRLRAELAERFGIDVTERQARASDRAPRSPTTAAHLDEGRDQASLDGASRPLRRGRCARRCRAATRSADRQRGLTEALLASLRFSAFPDVRPALERAACRRRAAIVVVSNWDVSLHGRARAARARAAARRDPDLGRGGRAQAGAGDLRAGARGSPGPRRSEPLHVGDSLEEDVAGARGAGIEPVLVRRDGGPAPPGVRTIASLAELTSAGSLT